MIGQVDEITYGHSRMTGGSCGMVTGPLFSLKEARTALEEVATCMNMAGEIVRSSLMHAGHDARVTEVRSHLGYDVSWDRTLPHE